MTVADGSDLGNCQALHNIPSNMRIRILYSDSHIIVIDKPGNLRSVPGNADSENKTAGVKRRRRDEATSQSTALTAQEAWSKAILTLSTAHKESGDVVDQCLVNLGTPESAIASVPRKFSTFQRYVQRSRQRIFLDNQQQTTEMSKEDIEKACKKMYQRIEAQQKLLTSKPEPTLMEESAFGQVLLCLGLTSADISMQKSLFVVHRLDCATSGIMVFARTENSASVLSKAWRERASVHKTYLALVHSWPPLVEQGEIHGEITLPLAPSEECIKWKVCEQGKPCKTLWKVVSKPDDCHTRLQLTPVTGRTH
jgi:23S rRNA-/tRNA-specific pseudouridylate synthase